jgi:acyl-homoserine lactone acylase PvdQ
LSKFDGDFFTKTLDSIVLYEHHNFPRGDVPVLLFRISTISVFLLYPFLVGWAEQPTLASVRPREVLIERDRWGIPHIYGQTMTAVAFGAGYVQAEDHLEGMLRLYLVARGESSRVEGPSALADDVIERTLMHREIVEQTWSAVPQSSRDYYQAFADGINRYMETHAQEKQPWYWKITAQDVATYLRYTIMRYSLRIAMTKLGGPNAVRQGEGSNAFAIAASRSANGHAMLHGDPHLPWYGENRMGYEMHLKCPELDVAGAGFFGEPTPLIGHNADAAWTATNNAANTADVFEEKIDPRNPDRYLDSDGQWKQMEKRTVKIEVRQPDGSMQTVEKVLRCTHRGPFTEVRGHGYSISIPRWKDFPDPLTGYILRAKVRNVDDFRASLQQYPMDKWNLIFADRQGDIYYVDNGVFPKRGTGYDYNQPVPGWEPGAQWTGYVPFKDLPQFTNPPSGVIVQCNNSPYSTTQPPVLDPANFSKYLAHSWEVANLPLSRAERGIDLFKQHEKVSAEDFRQAALDLKVLHAGPYVQALSDASANQDDPDLREVHSILKNWDGRATVDNRALPILEHWQRIALARKLKPAVLGDREQCLAILKETIAQLKQLYGKISVPFGDVQIFSHGKDYSPPGHDSLWAITTSYKDGKWHVNGGSSWLMLIEFSTPLKVSTIAPLGESDNPSSPHFADQTAMFAKQEMKPFPFTDDEVKSLLEKSYRLKM